MAYFWAGAVHMLTGYDHLLFLFGVMFFLTSFKDIVTFITAFTVGHSITLISATLYGVQANYFLIDAVIAISVIYKGFDNLDGFRRWFGIEPPNLLAMVFGFGLIHGFGLAPGCKSSGCPTMACCPPLGLQCRCRARPDRSPRCHDGGPLLLSALASLRHSPSSPIPFSSSREACCSCFRCTGICTMPTLTSSDSALTCISSIISTTTSREAESRRLNRRRGRRVSNPYRPSPRSETGATMTIASGSRRRFGLATFAFLMGGSPASAHPHVWVTAQTTVLFDNGAIGGLHYVWTFDELYTAMAIEGLDTNNDGAYDTQELADLAQTNMDGMQDLGYFTVAKLGDSSIKFKSPIDYWCEYKDGILTLYFTLPLEHLVPIEANRSRSRFTTRRSSSPSVRRRPIRSGSGRALPKGARQQRRYRKRTRPKSSASARLFLSADRRSV